MVENTSEFKRREMPQRLMNCKCPEQMIKVEAPRFLAVGVNVFGNAAIEAIAEKSFENIACVKVKDSSEIGTLSRQDNADIVFIVADGENKLDIETALMLAEAAKAKGKLVVGIIASPCSQSPKTVAGQLYEKLDTFLLADAENLNKTAEQFILGLHSLVYPLAKSLISIDFDDIAHLLIGAGKVFFGTGGASGENRAEEAAKAALAQLPIPTSKKAKRILVQFIALKNDVGLMELTQAVSFINEAIGHEEAEVLWGLNTNDAIGSDMQIAVLAGKFA